MLHWCCMPSPAHHTRMCCLAFRCTAGVLTETTAEIAAALTFAAARRVVEADSFMRNGHYKGWLPTLFIGALLQNKTVSSSGSRPPWSACMVSPGGIFISGTAHFAAYTATCRSRVFWVQACWFLMLEPLNSACCLCIDTSLQCNSGHVCHSLPCTYTCAACRTWPTALLAPQVGIIGAGRIGSAYARMMVEGHKMNLVYYDPYPNTRLEEYIKK